MGIKRVCVGEGDWERLLSVSSKLVMKEGLSSLENMGGLRVNGMLEDDSFLVIPMLPWDGN